MPALILSVTLQDVRLELIQATPHLPFAVGDEVRVKYWDEEEILYCWSARITTVTGTRGVSLCLQDQGVTLQRRKMCRMEVPLPFGLTVIEAAERRLAGTTLRNLSTRNISPGGLRFETDCPLKPGDKLEILLRLGPGKIVKTSGWVVRSDPAPQESAALCSIAVEFIYLHQEEQRQLTDFLINSNTSEGGTSAFAGGAGWTP